MGVDSAGGCGLHVGPLAETDAGEGHERLILTRSLMSGYSRHDPGTGVPGVTRIGWSPDGRIGAWVVLYANVGGRIGELNFAAGRGIEWSVRGPREGGEI